MGAGQSKDELLYQEAQNGNHDAVKALRRSGASLEWIDKEGRTPLILACTRGELLDMAITLLNLGANVDVYRPGMHRGTPLHHAAKRGLEKTVTLLLSRGGRSLYVAIDFDGTLVGFLTVYAHNTPRERARFWAQLIDALPNVDTWIVGGDFNNIESDSDWCSDTRPVLSSISPHEQEEWDRFLLATYVTDLDTSSPKSSTKHQITNSRQFTVHTEDSTLARLSSEPKSIGSKDWHPFRYFFLY
ncbi:hypothetical protein L7F22_022275 [Adiantum nelumboides]|nr:hypothetical protein [Adiantum nelumboides]